MDANTTNAPRHLFAQLVLAEASFVSVGGSGERKWTDVGYTSKKKKKGCLYNKVIHSPMERANARSEEHGVGSYSNGMVKRLKYLSGDAQLLKRF